MDEERTNQSRNAIEDNLWIIFNNDFDVVKFH